MNPKKRIGEMLLEAGIIDETQLKAALGHQRQWGVRLGQALVDLKLATEADIVRALSLKFGFEVAKLDALEPYGQEQAVKLFPREFVVRNNVLPMWADTANVTVAMSDPTNLAVVDEIRFRTGRRVKVCIGGDREVAEAVNRHYPGDGNVEAIALDLDADLQGSGEAVFDPFGGGSKDALEAFFGGSSDAPPGVADAPTPFDPPAPPAPVAAERPAPPAPAPAPRAQAARAATEPAPQAVPVPVPAARPTSPPGAQRPAAPAPQPPAAAPKPPPAGPQPSAAGAQPAPPRKPAPQAPGAPQPRAAPAAPGAARPPTPAPAAARPSAAAPAPPPGPTARAARPAAPAAPAPAPAPAAPAQLAPRPRALELELEEHPVAARRDDPFADPGGAEELTPFEEAPSRGGGPQNEPILASDLAPEEEMVEGPQPSRDLSDHELAILESLDRLADGAPVEPEVVKPAQAMAAMIRLLIRKRLVSEEEFLDELSKK